MTTRLVATVMAHSPDAVERWLVDPPPGVSYVELRLDALADPTEDTVKKLLGLNRTVPVIATCRAAHGGHGFAGSDEDRLALLAAAGEAGAELIDVDDMLLDGFPKSVPGERIASCHLHRFVPRLEALALRVAGHDTRFSKLAVPASTPVQLAELLDLQEQLGDHFSLMTTGRLAEAGRVMAAGRGAALIFGAADPLDRGHPDQPSVERLHTVHTIETVGPSTRFYAVVGHPVGHSMSPAYHNTVFRKTGTDARLVLMDLEGMEDVMAMADSLRLDGLAVTQPYKQEALEHAASALPGATTTGAANTLLRTPSGWQARNTDWKAACDLLPKMLRRWRKRHGDNKPKVLMLGSGGAARACAIALAEENVDIAVWSRDYDHAQILAEDLETEPVSDLTGLQADLVINATPIGMPDVDTTAWRLAPSNFADNALALDLAYGGEHSPFRQCALDAGAHLTTGEDFFAVQARRQAELFGGTAIAADVHKEASRRCGASA